MSEISDLESRISAAMDRISRGLEGLAAPAAQEAGEDDSALKEARDALENEKLANAQLEDRVQSLKDKLAETETALAESKAAVEQAAEARDAAEEEMRAVQAAAEAATEAATEAAGAAPTIDLDEERDTIAQLARRLRRLRRTSRQLRSTGQQLREAAEKGLSDPALINQALAAELDDLQAIRAAEIAEMDVITAALRPMLGDGVADADDGQEDN